jgi:hypothetical protein
LAPDYIGSLPVETKSAAGACYVYKSDGKDYKMLAKKTVETGLISGKVPVDDPFYDSANGGADNNYQISTPDAKTW